tara:strand:- start:222 stop:686 length:465 start_codon:yes stop_codon:yes gene_type:complete
MPIATSSERINLFSENKTKELANKISLNLRINDIVFLYGEMGVGKTTFTRYLINELQKKNNLKETEVTSPTFSILNEYLIKKIKINHYDLFRLKSSAELKNLDLFSDRANSITIVEWPEIIKEKPQNLIELKFKYEKNYEKRSVQIKGLDLLFK